MPFLMNDNPGVFQCHPGWETLDQTYATLVSPYIDKT